MKYISLQDLIDYGKELRFQSEEQMAKVYDRMPGIEIVRCKDCRWFNKSIDRESFGYCGEVKHIYYTGCNENYFCGDGEEKQ